MQRKTNLTAKRGNVTIKLSLVIIGNELFDVSGRNYPKRRSTLYISKSCKMTNDIDSANFTYLQDKVRVKHSNLIQKLNGFK